MTSNLRSAESMREFFRPEFLNRIDEVVEFQALSREQLGRSSSSSSGAYATGSPSVGSRSS